MKKAQNENEGEAKEHWKTLWNNMSDKKKVVWINWAAEEEAKYKVISIQNCVFVFVIIAYFTGNSKGLCFTASELRAATNKASPY